MDPSLEVAAWEAAVEKWAQETFPAMFEPEPEPDGTGDFPPHAGEE